MTKAILVFDGYETLKEQYNKKVLVNIFSLDEKGDAEYYSTEYAILKELPQKKFVQVDYNHDINYALSCLGYNKCLKDILGEEYE